MKNTKYCGRGCNDNLSFFHCCQPFKNKMNRMTQFNVCPMRYKTILYYIESNFKIYKQIINKDYSYLKSKNFTDNEIKDIVYLFEQDQIMP